MLNPRSVTFSETLISNVDRRLVSYTGVKSIILNLLGVSGLEFRIFFALIPLNHIFQRRLLGFWINGCLIMEIVLCG